MKLCLNQGCQYVFNHCRIGFNLLISILNLPNPPTVVFIWKLKLWTKILVVGRRLGSTVTYCILSVLIWWGTTSTNQLRTSSHEASLKCEHGTYEPTSLVSPHESNWVWNSPLVPSHVNHHPWTYPLMAQHLLIHICINAYKQRTQTALYLLRLEALAWATRPIPHKLSFIAWASVL